MATQKEILESLDFTTAIQKAVDREDRQQELGLEPDEDPEDFLYEQKKRRERMAVPGDAIVSSLERLSREWPEMMPFRAGAREIATEMITPPSLPTPLGDIPYGRGVKAAGEAMGIDPDALYQWASGKPYYSPAEIEKMFYKGEITDIQRRAIMKEQMTFGDNFGRVLDELHEMFGIMVPAIASASATVGTQIGERDLEGLKESGKTAGKFVGLGGDFIVSSLIDLTTRPWEYAREDFIDAATWMPISLYAKALKGSAIGTKAVLKAGASPIETGKALKLVYQTNNATDLIRGAAATVVAKLPLPNIVKQTFFDLYAGTDEALEVMRTQMRLSNQRYNIIFEEQVMNKLAAIVKQIKKENDGVVDPQEVERIFNALVEGISHEPIRKEALAWKAAKEKEYLGEVGITDGLPPGAPEEIMGVEVGARVALREHALEDLPPGLVKIGTHYFKEGFNTKTFVKPEDAEKMIAAHRAKTKGAAPRKPTPSKVLPDKTIPFENKRAWLYELSILDPAVYPSSIASKGYLDSGFLNHVFDFGDQFARPLRIVNNQPAKVAEQTFFFGTDPGPKSMFGGYDGPPTPMLFYHWKELKNKFLASGQSDPYKFALQELRKSMEVQRKRLIAEQEQSAKMAREGVPLEARNDYIEKWGAPFMPSFEEKLAEFAEKSLEAEKRVLLANLIDDPKGTRLAPTKRAEAKEAKASFYDQLTEGKMAIEGAAPTAPKAADTQGLPTLPSGAVIPVLNKQIKPDLGSKAEGYGEVLETDILGTMGWVKDLDGKVYLIKVDPKTGTITHTKSDPFADRPKGFKPPEGRDFGAPAGSPVTGGVIEKASSAPLDEAGEAALRQPGRTTAIPQTAEEMDKFIHERLWQDRKGLREYFEYKDKVGDYQPKEIIWNYDGVPMTSAEFLFDLSIKEFDVNKISYTLLENSDIGKHLGLKTSDIVRNNAEAILNVKKLMSELLSAQTGVRGSKLDNSQFMTQDMFRAVVSSYLPKIVMPTHNLPDIDAWLKFTDESQVGGKIFVAGAEHGKNPVQFAQTEKMRPDRVDHLINEGYATGQNFVEALELSIPRLIDTVERYALYGKMAKDSNLSSVNPVEGWKKISGKVALRRSKERGGNVERYGELEGMYVPPEVYRILKATEQHVRDWDGFWPRAAKQYTRLLNMVKHNKLIANFSSHAHNLYGLQQVLIAEGINPGKLATLIPELLQGFDNVFYKASAMTGTLPKAAPGFGDVGDILKSIATTRNPKEFVKLLFKDLEKQAAKDGFTVGAMNTLGRGGPELAMKTAEWLSYNVLGGQGKMAQFFVASDRLARYALFKTQLEKLAKMNKMTPLEAVKVQDLVNDAARYAEEIMLQYSDLPFFIQFLRATGQQPFIAYPWRATKYAMEYPFRRPEMYKGLMAGYQAERGLDTPGQRRRRTSAYPGDFLYPMSQESADLLSAAVTPFGADPYSDLTLSPRYVSAIPVIPEETYGYDVDKYTGADLLGEQRPTYEDRRNIVAKETGKNIPLPMHVEPGFDLAFGDPLKAAWGMLPSYLEKSLGKETLWSEPYPKRDFRLQAFTGIRHMPKDHRSFALSRGRRKLKRLKGSPRYGGATAREKMQLEREALVRGWRESMY